MPSPVSAFIGIGANLGDSHSTVVQAIQNLAALPGTALVKASSLYQTSPVDASGPDYVNAVVEVSTLLDAASVLGHLQRLEATAGRRRPYRNAPRTLDLDILLFGDQAINTPRLQVPHPRMNERAFVLMPLAEIAPHRVNAAQMRAVQGQRITRV